MSRQPSIHVTEQDLTLALDRVIGSDNTGGKPNHLLAKELVTILRTKTLINRSIIVSNDKLETKATKLVSSSRGDADMLANIIYNYRKKLKHYGITQIKPNSRDWTTLKELTKSVNDFCSSFGLSKRAGYIEYIKIAYSKVSSHNNILNKMLMMYEGICEDYQAMSIINKDDDPNLTKRIHDLYTVQIVSKTGLPISYENEPKKYAYFIKVRQEAKEIGISPDIYLKAQFYGFEWRDGIPDPVQLVGPKAKDRLNKYLYEKNIKVSQAKDVISSSDKMQRLLKLKQNY